MKAIADLITQKKRDGSTVFVCGNGGSAATAEHFTNDLFSRGVRAVCLNSNTAIMTMIANDYGYEYVFSKQLEVYAEEGDLLVLISVSGKSPNIEMAKKINIETVQLFGEPGENYAQAEDRHLRIAHEISEMV